MKWFNRILGQKQNDSGIISMPSQLGLGALSANQIPQYSNYNIKEIMNDTCFGTNPITLKIYKADGGFVVETSHFEKSTEQHDNRLYIINDDADLGERLNHIITLHALRT